MLRKYFILTILIVFSSAVAQTNYNDGFKSGYKDGYCQDQGIGCLAPIPPIAPIPKIGENTDNYKDGYNRGFVMGLEAQKKGKTNYSNQTRERYKTQSIELSENNIYNPYKNIQGAIELANALRNSKGQALKYLEEENYQQAANIAYTGLSVSPKDNEFMLILGQSFKGVNDNANAIKWFKKALNNGFNDYNGGLKNLIINLENESNNNNGNQISQKNENEDLKEKANQVKIFLESVKNLYENRKYNETILFIDNEKNILPIDFKEGWKYLYNIRGNCNYFEKKYFEAINDYTSSLNNSEKENSNTIYRRALCKTEVGDHNGAIEDYDKLIQFELAEKGSVNDLATIYNNKAYALTNLKKYNEALPFVKKALELNKSYWYIWDTKGEIEYNLGNYAQCIKDMSEAIKLKKEANSLYFRGLSYLKIGKKELSCIDLKKSGELGKKDAYYEINKHCK